MDSVIPWNCANYFIQYKKERGVIAQELKEILPQAVETIPPIYTDLGESIHLALFLIFLFELR